MRPFYPRSCTMLVYFGKTNLVIKRTIFLYERGTITSSMKARRSGSSCAPSFSNLFWRSVTVVQTLSRGLIDMQRILKLAGSRIGKRVEQAANVFVEKLISTKMFPTQFQPRMSRKCFRQWTQNRHRCRLSPSLTSTGNRPARTSQPKQVTRVK